MAGGKLIVPFDRRFPVHREGAYLSALREAKNVVHDGILLLMFPEGTRSKDHKLHQGFPGTALVAYRWARRLCPSQSGARNRLSGRPSCSGVLRAPSGHAHWQALLPASDAKNHVAGRARGER